jgi:hypothetical protein
MELLKSHVHIPVVGEGEGRGGGGGGGRDTLFPGVNEVSCHGL